MPFLLLPAHKDGTRDTKEHCSKAYLSPTCKDILLLLTRVHITVQIADILYNCSDIIVHTIHFTCHFLLDKGGYVFGSVGLSVCLFVCLFVDNITQKVINGLGRNFMEGSLVVQ